SVRRLREVGTRRLETPSRLLALGVDPGELHVDRGEALRGRGDATAQVGLLRAEAAQIRAELRRPRRIGLDALPDSRLVRGDLEGQGSLEAACRVGEPLQDERVDATGGGAARLGERAGRSGGPLRHRPLDVEALLNLA